MRYGTQNPKGRYSGAPCVKGETVHTCESQRQKKMTDGAERCQHSHQKMASNTVFLTNLLIESDNYWFKCNCASPKISQTGLCS